MKPNCWGIVSYQVMSTVLSHQSRRNRCRARLGNLTSATLLTQIRNSPAVGTSGRTGSILVQWIKPTYGLLCGTLERNSARARMVGQASEFRWSSAGAQSEAISHPNWLDAEPMQSTFTPEEREVNLKSESIGEADIKLRKNTYTGRPTGSREFVDWAESSLGRKLAAQSGCRPLKSSAASAARGYAQGSYIGGIRLNTRAVPSFGLCDLAECGEHHDPEFFSGSQAYAPGHYVEVGFLDFPQQPIVNLN